MAYIGTSPTQAVRTRFLYTATASQTTFSGADTQNLTLRYSDANFVDVYQNGVLLKGGGADYTATTTTSVVLATGATADDVIEIIVYDVFAVANLIKKDGDTVEGVINFNGKEITLDADFDTSITADTDDQIDIKIGGTDRVVIDSSGNVGIGTTSPGARLDVTSTDSDAVFLRSSQSTTTNVYITNTNATADNTANLFFAPANNVAGSKISSIAIEDFSTSANRTADLAFSTRKDGTMSEATRIDSSGNVLVGRTSTISGGSNSASGAQIGSNGLIQSAVSGDTAISLQRLSDNGDIIQFRKDTTSVGSIGTGSSRLAIGNDDTFLTFAGDLDALYPASSSQTTPRDNAVDLGTSGTRFKDLYLSGGLFIGGTTSANELDDYEEGTFTPTTSSSGYTLSDSSGTYTKVGRLVNLHVRMVFSSIGSSNSNVACNNVPFVKVSGDHAIGVGRETSTNGAIFVCQLTQNTNVLHMNSMDGISNNSQEAFQAHKHYKFHIAFET